MALYSQEVCTHFFVKPRNKGWLNVNQILTVCFSLFFASSAPGKCSTLLSLLPLACLNTTAGARMNVVRGEADFCLFASVVYRHVLIHMTYCLGLKKKKRGKKKVWCVLICLVVFWGKYSSRWRVVLNLTLRLETGAFLEQHSEKQGTSETQSFSFLSKQRVREKPKA